MNILDFRKLLSLRANAIRFSFYNLQLFAQRIDILSISLSISYYLITTDGSLYYIHNIVNLVILKNIYTVSRIGNTNDPFDQYLFIHKS